MIDLTNCDREPIHIPGKIQPHGVLLVLQEPQLIILQASTNTETCLGRAAESLIGRDLTGLFPQSELSFLTHCLCQPHLEYFNSFTLTNLGNPAIPRFDGIMHRHDGVLILELEPKQSTQPSYPLGFYPLVREAIHQISQETNFTDFSQRLAQQVQQITGYDRVMVYRFESDQSGVVIAEAKTPELESFLGLHYPPSDIPQQARILYQKNWLRLIVDVNYQPVDIVPLHNPLTQTPLDLSYGVLRSVSPIHVEYLQNMGVSASLTISLLDDNQLWGLITCHHYQAKYVDYSTRQACEFLGKFVSIELFKQQQKQLEEYRHQTRGIQQILKQALSEKPEKISQILSTHHQNLLALVNASGAVISLSGELIRLGNTPNPNQLKALLNWLAQQDYDETFHTHSLSQLYPPAQSYQKQASGILAISITIKNQFSAIVWFRPEVIQIVNWGGNPEKPVVVHENGDIRLSPRKSFELWQQTVRGKSLPWQSVEIEAARELKNTLMLALLTVSESTLATAYQRAEIANRAKSEFLANMSHEIRTPMNAILGFCDLLKGLVTDEKQRSYLDGIATGGKSLLTLINDILDLSKIESGKLELHYEAINIRGLIQEIEQIFGQTALQKNLIFLIEIEPELPEAIYIDEIRLRQILFNLVGNAFKFTEQGYVKVAVSCEHNLDSLNQTQLTLVIEDTGIGIDPSQQERIFEAFQQSEGQSNRKYGGTGLGLAISRRLTTLLGGELHLESELSKGSRFTLIFPNVTEVEISVSSVISQDKDENLDQFQPSTLLVVDDVASNRDLIQGYFSGTQHRILLADNGLQGIQQAHTYHPDVILLDLRMPNLDGQEVAHYLKQNQDTQGIPIIIITASALQKDYDELQSFCQGFLQKPVSRTQLVKALKQILPLQHFINGEDREDGRDGGDGGELTAQVRDNLPQLLVQLRQEQETVWSTICRTMKRREISGFAQRLESLATEYNSLILQDYVLKITSQLEAFDWANLPKTIEQFPLVIEELESRIKDL